MPERRAAALYPSGNDDAARNAFRRRILPHRLQPVFASLPHRCHPSRGKSLRNIEEASQALIDLQEMGITNADELEAKVQESSKAYDELKDRVKNNEARVKQLDKVIKQAAIYKKYLPIKQALNEPRYQYKKAREKYRTEHDSELVLFEAARRILTEFSPGKQWTDDTVADWKKELAKLRTKVTEESPKVKIARDEMLKLRGIQNTLERYLKPRREIEHEPER